MRQVIIATMIVLCTATAFAAGPPKTEEQKTAYAVGMAVARSLTVFTLTAEELEFVKQGITDAVTGKKPAVDLNTYGVKVQELARSRRKILADKQAAANKAYVEKAAQQKGVVKTGSGVIYTSARQGAGVAPGATDKVKVNYRGTLIDGTEFDSSYRRGTASELPVNGVIKCLQEGLQMMMPGGKATFVCPSELAYGDAGFGDAILPGATLVFEVELLEVVKEGSRVPKEPLPRKP